MISEEEKKFVAAMSAEAAELDSRCATEKPARLPQHELAY